MNRVIYTLSFFFCFILLFIYLPCALSAGDDAATWSKIDLPAAGKSGGWVLAGVNGIRCLTQAVDGTLYCYATPAGTSYTLFKSKDDGQTWSDTGGVKDAIVDIATSPENAGIVYYCTAATVYESVDAGTSFSPLPYCPCGAGINNVSLTAIAVVYSSGRHLVAAAIADADAGQFGSVYLYDESDSNPLTCWENTALGNYDVYDVAFSPQPVVGQYHLAAAANDEAATVIAIRIGDTPWGSIISDTTLPPGTLAGADIAFPDDYGASQQDFNLFVGLNTGSNSGDLYIVYGGVYPAASSFVDVDAGRPSGLSSLDISSIALVGDSRTATIFAGAANSPLVYFSIDGGAIWSKSRKPPTGISNTAIIAAKDYLTSGKIFAATSGTECGFSVSTDFGLTWDQLSFINTQISAIVDFVPSPNFSGDNTLFALTFGNGKHSLWRSESAGLHWSRVFSSTLPDITGLDYVRLSPAYGNGSKTVFLTGTSGTGPALWKSDDNAATFADPRITYDPETGTPFNILQCVPVDDDSLVLGTFDGSEGLIYRTEDSGWSFTPKAAAGTTILNSIVLSPSYNEDHTILAGNKAGWIFLSEDGGNSFAPLPADVSTAPLSGNVSVAFDNDFDHNRKVYAASDTAGKGIFRFTVGLSTKWESIDGSLPAGAIINQVCPSAASPLYALNNKPGAGLERSLNPASAGPIFETITRNLDTTARLSGLVVSGNCLWAMDTFNIRLMTLMDTLTMPIVLIDPPDEAAGLNTTNTRLDWAPAAGATTYEWQIDTDTAFTTVPAGFDDTTQSTSARLPELEPATTYYWRVRSTGPVLSPWSERRSFTTVLSGEIVSPQLNSPAAGATVSLKPVFQWSPIAGAEKYELLIGGDNTFTNIVVAKSGAEAIPATAWQCEQSLNPDTTYYWKVRASSTLSFSAWSNLSVFTTEPDPTTSPAAAPVPAISTPENSPVPTTLIVTAPGAPPSPATTTQIIQIQQSTPEWVRWLFYIGGAMILILTLVLVMMLVIMFRMEHKN